MTTDMGRVRDVKWTPDTNGGSAASRSSQGSTTNTDDLKVTIYPLLVSCRTRIARPNLPQIIHRCGNCRTRFALHDRAMNAAGHFDLMYSRSATPQASKADRRHV